MRLVGLFIFWVAFSMHRKRFISNTIFPVSAGLVAQIIQIFILPLFIENLGAEMYGLFVISTLLVGYVGVLDFGFTEGLTRQVGRAYSENNEKKLSEAVSTGFWLLLGIGALSATAIYLGRFLLVDFLKVGASERELAAQLFTVTAIFSLLQWPLKLPQVILRGTLHIKQEGLAQAATAVVVSLVMLLLVLVSNNVVDIRVGSFAVMAGGLLLQGLLVRRYVPSLRWGMFAFNPSACREMASYSAGMFYTKLLSLLSIRIDQLIIGGMIGAAAIAPYMVASRLFEVVVNNTNKLFGAFLPTVFNLDTDQNRHKLQTLLDDGTRYRALLISPLAYLGIVISPSFIRTWMGPDYVQYAIWSQLFMVPLLFNVFGFGVNIARGRGKLLATNSILTVRVFVNVVLSIILTPPLGIGGPIVGTLVASTVLGDGVFLGVFCKICGLKSANALKQGFCIMLLNLPFALLLLYFITSMRIESWFILIIVAITVCLILYSVLFLAFFREKEKQDLFLAFDQLGLTRIQIVNRMLREALLKGV